MRRIAKKKIPLSKLKTLRFQAVLKREGGKCLKCGTDQHLSPSHIYPTGTYPRMAWELDNIILLCWFRCHLRFWHANPMEAKEWIKTVLPKARLQKLKAMTLVQLPPLNHIKIKEYLELTLLGE